MVAMTIPATMPPMIAPMLTCLDDEGGFELVGEGDISTTVVVVGTSVSVEIILRGAFNSIQDQKQR